MRSRAAWAPDRVHQVRLHSFWKRRDASSDDERWKVTALFRYEQSQGDVLSVRVRSFGGFGGGSHVRHMSEARFLQLFAEVDR